MSFSSAGSSLHCKAPLRFHQVREGETTENIAAKYNVEVQKILKDNPGVEAYSNGKIPVGEMIVLSLKV